MIDISMMPIFMGRKHARPVAVSGLVHSTRVISSAWLAATSVISEAASWSKTTSGHTPVFEPTLQVDRAANGADRAAITKEKIIKRRRQCIYRKRTQVTLLRKQREKATGQNDEMRSSSWKVFGKKENGASTAR